MGSTQYGWPAAQVVRIGRDRENIATVKHLPGTALRQLAKAADQRAGRHLQQTSLIEKGIQFRRIAHDVLIAFRVGDERQHALFAQPCGELFGADRHLTVREFQEQHGLAAQRPQKRQLAGGEQIDQLLADAHLTASGNRQSNLILRQILAKLRHRLCDAVGPVFKNTGLHMRCHHCMKDAIGDRRTRQRQRLIKRLGAVVNARQVVTMQINHRARLFARWAGLSGPLRSQAFEP